MSDLGNLYFVRVDEIDNGIKVTIPKNVIVGMKEIILEYTYGEDEIFVNYGKGKVTIPVPQKYFYAATLLSMSSQFYPRNLDFNLIKYFNKKGKPIKKIPLKKTRESSKFLSAVIENPESIEDLDWIDLCSDVY